MRSDIYTVLACSTSMSWTHLYGWWTWSWEGSTWWQSTVKICIWHGINKMHANFPHCNNNLHIVNLFCESVRVRAQEAGRRSVQRNLHIWGQIVTLLFISCTRGDNSSFRNSCYTRTNFLAFIWSQLYCSCT